MQLTLFKEEIGLKTRENSIANKIMEEDRVFHDWYRFVLSFPPHLVREYIKKFRLGKIDTLLDPFCGTGTTLVEAKLNSVPSLGCEANAMAFLASKTKINWEIDPEKLINTAKKIETDATSIEKVQHINETYRLNEEQKKLILKDSIDELPLSKALLLCDLIKKSKHEELKGHLLLALAKILVYSISNLHFGPEVGVRKSKKKDYPVYLIWLNQVISIASDIKKTNCNRTVSRVFNIDSRDISDYIEKSSVSAVFTSPPYPNEKDYTRTTRLESVILGLIRSKEELKNLKFNLLRSNTRNVYKVDNDEEYIKNNSRIIELADTIEKKRIALGKTSGFEKLYPRVVKLYFGGMARHLAQLRMCLKPGAILGYVIGDQASYFQVLIQTGSILEDIARELGYKIISLDLFRTRLATATKKQMREEVLVLEWPG
ncbi:MAG: DNA methyltransferase [Planctomycetes bacterium]|nr:DNA methyltransferase [Planctomycetota bacterium]